MDRLNLAKISQLFFLKPVEEINYGPMVCAPGIRVPDLRREKFDETSGSLGSSLTDQCRDAGVSAGSQLPLGFPY